MLFAFESEALFVREWQIYTGKIRAGLIGQAHRGEFAPDSRVLFLHTDGLPSVHPSEATLMACERVPPQAAPPRRARARARAASITDRLRSASWPSAPWVWAGRSASLARALASKRASFSFCSRSNRSW